MTARADRGDGPGGGMKDVRRWVLMGVSGCGKTSVGLLVAPALGVAYRDGDELHPDANIEKMATGVPLTDTDRWPWLHAVGQALRAEDLIVGCSALKRSYRDLIRAEAKAPVCFIHLSGSMAVIAGRMHKREGHFMPETLLASQFAALEPPGPDECALTVDIDQPLEGVVAAILNGLNVKDARRYSG